MRLSYKNKPPLLIIKPLDMAIGQKAVVKQSISRSDVGKTIIRNSHDYFQFESGGCFGATYEDGLKEYLIHGEVELI